MVDRVADEAVAVVQAVAIDRHAGLILDLDPNLSSRDGRIDAQAPAGHHQRLRGEHPRHLQRLQVREPVQSQLRQADRALHGVPCAPFVQARPARGIACLNPLPPARHVAEAPRIEVRAVEAVVVEPQLVALDHRTADAVDHPRVPLARPAGGNPRLTVGLPLPVDQVAAPRQMHVFVAFDVRQPAGDLNPVDAAPQLLQAGQPQPFVRPAEHGVVLAPHRAPPFGLGRIALVGHQDHVAAGLGVPLRDVASFAHRHAGHADDGVLAAGQPLQTAPHAAIEDPSLRLRIPHDRNAIVLERQVGGMVDVDRPVEAVGGVLG